MDRRAFLRRLAGAAALAGSRPVMRPNILLILADQFRHDALGRVRPWVRTPHLDALAASGIRFASAYAAQAVCSPSRASIFSGLYPHVHGVRDNLYGVPDATRDPRFRLRRIFPALLREAGYRTGYIGKWHLGEAKPDAFDVWHGFNSLLPHWLGKPHASPYRSDGETDRGIAFLKAHRDRPFFLCQSYYPPHTPYTAPERFEALYRGKGHEPAAYYAAVSAIDGNVGRLLAALHDLGLADRTLVIFTADHGDTFGKRPGSKHKNVAFDDSARVPLILRVPGDPRGGAVREDLVCLVDLMPTILAFVGLAGPEGLHGRSLLALLRGAAPRTSLCFQNRPWPPKGKPRCESRAIRTRAWKLILRDRLPRGGATLRDLYDLLHDPGERRNLFGRDHGDEIDALLAYMDDWALAAACRRALRDAAGP